MKNEDLHPVAVHKEPSRMVESIKENNTAVKDEKKSRVLGLINGQIFARSFYVVSGILLFSSLVVMFNTYLLHLKVETAVVSAVIEPIMSPVGGYIADVFVDSGQEVKKGDPLFKIENIFLEIKLQLARVKMEESKLAIDYYQTLIANENQRLNVYKKIGRNRLVSARSMVGVSRKNVIIAQKTLERFESLHKKNYVSHSLMEEKQANYESAQEQLNNAMAQNNVEKHSLNAIHQGMYFTGTKTEGITHDLEAELMAAQRKVKLNHNRVLIYEKLIDRLTLMAPFDGKVTQILKSAGNTADNKSPIILIEKTSDNRNIIAWLTQNEVIHIGKSRVVKIYIPSSGKVYQGNITEINRTDGFVDEVKAQYKWRDFQMDRSAMVSIAIKNTDQIEFNQQAFPGMPVVVYFSKKFSL